MDQAPDLSIQDPNHPSDDEAKSLEKKPPKPIKSSLSSFSLASMIKFNSTTLSGRADRTFPFQSIELQ